MRPPPMILALLASPVALGAELPSSVRAVVQQAETAELPTALLEQKALEGLAKGAPENRIRSVLADLLAQWYGAEQVLGERARGPDRAELVPAAAAALREGAPTATVIDLAGAPSSPAGGLRPSSSSSRTGSPTAAAEALWTLSDVLYAGLSPDDAERVVRQALASRDPDVALQQLPEATRLLVAGEGPVAAAQQLTLTLGAGDTPLDAVDAAPGSSGDHSKAGGNGRGNSTGPGDGKAGGKSP